MHLSIFFVQNYIPLFVQGYIDFCKVEINLHHMTRYYHMDCGYFSIYTAFNIAIHSEKI